MQCVVSGHKLQNVYDSAKRAIELVAGMFFGWDDLLWCIDFLVSHNINTFTNTIIVCR